MTNLIVIPARLESTRLSQKLLRKAGGKTILEYTYQKAGQVSRADQVIIAADSGEIVSVAQGFGAEVVLTSAVHPSGTDRVAEVARDRDCDLVINVQGDEPDLPPDRVDTLISLLEANPTWDMATLACVIEDEREIDDPSCVKVTLATDGRALYFSRSTIPYQRNRRENTVHYRHLGLYGYRRDFLLKLVELPPSMLEREEGLEQLRALENGFQIGVAVVDQVPPGIDTEDDYQAFVKRVEG